MQNRRSFGSDDSFDDSMLDIGLDDPLFKLIEKLDKVPSKFDLD
jgi:hypothetical protein